MLSQMVLRFLVEENITETTVSRSFALKYNINIFPTFIFNGDCRVLLFSGNVHHYYLSPYICVLCIFLVGSFVCLLVRMLPVM